MCTYTHDCALPGRTVLTIFVLQAVPSPSHAITASCLELLLPNLTRHQRIPGGPEARPDITHPCLLSTMTSRGREREKDRKRQGPRCKPCSVVQQHNTRRVAQFPRI
ncbi:hypothetical protein VZT92_020745 [Zoarces viviparus]|uniref:Secreted protein n=1 Tax=Zoarces viviparus TaxID=48416 RepID=A0AAW1EED3_ZOAVI